MTDQTVVVETEAVMSHSGCFDSYANRFCSWLDEGC